MGGQDNWVNVSRFFMPLYKPMSNLCQKGTPLLHAIVIDKIMFY
jgi:hypothetical protein